MAITALQLRGRERERERPTSLKPIAIYDLPAKAMRCHFHWNLLIKAVTQNHPVYGGGKIDLLFNGKVGVRINIDTTIFGNYILQYLGYCDH